MNPVLFNRVAEALLLPPGLVVVLLLLALLLWRGRAARILTALALTVLYFASIPATAHWLLDSLEHRYPALSSEQLRTLDAGAIVVLGAGRYPDAPEYGADTVSSMALERLRYGAYLHRLTGLPILVTGGATMEQPVPEAELLQQSLKDDFGVLTVWTEDRSRTTAENARYSAELLTQRGIYRVLLVSHAMHMARAEGVFRRAGLEVIPAPTAFHRRGPLDRGVTAWLPRVSALRQTNQALHEYLGMAWYRLRGW